MRQSLNVTPKKSWMPQFFDDYGKLIVTSFEPLLHMLHLIFYAFIVFAI
jgi:hypothetical protein